jgi:hypothetical protein
MDKERFIQPGDVFTLGDGRTDLAWAVIAGKTRRPTNKIKHLSIGWCQAPRFEIDLGAALLERP